MTQKEIEQFLDNTKVYVAGKSKEIQEKLFSLGYSWNDECTGTGTDVCHTEAPFLFIYEDMSITMSSDMDIFCNHGNEEITAEQILSLKLQKPTYRPFKDKEECCKIIKKHQPFGWLRDNYRNCYRNITVVYDDKIELTPYFNDYGDVFKDTILYKDALKRISFFDGTPFGIKEK